MTSPRPLKRKEIEVYIDWTRVGPEELALVEQLDVATGSDCEKIIRELSRREVLRLPKSDEESSVPAAGGGPASLVQSIFGRFFVE